MANPNRRPVAALLTAAAILVALAADVRAQSAGTRGGVAPLPGASIRAASGQPVLFSAEELTHDRELGIVVARGKVEMTQADRTLNADVVSYNQRTNTATASGNVVMIEPNGDVLFSDYVELTEDLREGFVANVRMLMTDGGRLAGGDARRTNGNRTELDRGVYSPCDLCKIDPTRPPLWQVRAARVIHDQEKKKIEYRDAQLEMFGIPVAYTPYMSHPDPTVKRQSGFLVPTVGVKSDLGALAKVPYYFVLEDNMDFTFEPIVTSKQGVVLGGEFRHRLRYGYYELAGSATVADRTTGTNEDPVTKENKFRGHVKGKGRFDIDETWRVGFDLARSTDETYMRRYGYGSEETLTSRVYAEAFRGRSYAEVAAYTFQGLRPEDKDISQQTIAPIANYWFVGEPSEIGSYWTMDASALNLFRQEGVDSRRLSMRGAWQVPWASPIGDRYTFTASLRGDSYWASDVPVDPALGDASPTRDPTTARLFPQVSVNWRYPWVKSDTHVQYLIEPVAAFHAGPVAGRQTDIPNEDSLGFELTDVNILRANRFPGLDRLDGGQRVAYGMNVGAYHRNGMSARAFLAQSYSFQKNRAMPEGSGAEDYRSDLVGRLVLTPAEYLDLIYRFRLDKDDFTGRRHEVGFAAGPHWLKVFGSYSFLDAPPDEQDTGRREELVVGANVRFTPNWSTFGRAVIDLREGQEVLDAALGIKYEDECFAIVASYRRTRTRDLDIEPSDAVLVQLFFKNLGEFGLPRIQFQ